MVKTTKFIPIVIMLSVFCFGCSSDLTESNSLSKEYVEVRGIEGSNISFMNGKLTRDITIESNNDWKIDIDYLSGEDPWLTVTPDSGKGGESVRIEANDYYTPSSETRIAKLKLSVGNWNRAIDVSQQSIMIKLIASPSRLKINKDEGGRIYISSNVEWTSTYEEFDSNGQDNWYRLKKSGTSGNDSLIIVPTGSNNTFSRRSSTLTIYPKVLDLKDSIRYPELFQRVQIFQDKDPELYWEIPGDPFNKTVFFRHTHGTREVKVYSNVRWELPKDIEEIDWLTFSIIQDPVIPRLKHLLIEATDNKTEDNMQPEERTADFTLDVSDEEEKIAKPEEPIYISQEPARPK